MNDKVNNDLNLNQMHDSQCSLKATNRILNLILTKRIKNL